MAGVDLQWLTERLGGWAAAQYGRPATVTDVVAMPGHAGLSFGFTVEGGSATAGGERLVIRMPPKGVRRQGNTDVLRQVPLLSALARHGVPVPTVRWWSDDESWFPRATSTFT